MLQKAYALLDEATLPAIAAIVKLQKSRNPMVRLHAAKVILSKTIPDLSHQTGQQPTAIHVHYAHADPGNRLVVTQPIPTDVGNGH